MAVDPQAQGMAGAALSGLNNLEARLAAALSPKLVMLPVSKAQDIIGVQGASTGSIQTFAADNADGTGTSIAVTSAASPTYAGDVGIRRTINGNTIGIRLGLYGNYNNGAPFGVTVDEQPIEVNWSAEIIPETGVARDNTKLFGHYRSIILGTTFGDGPHDVFIQIPNDAAVTRTLSFHGWLAEEAAGYRANARGMLLYNPGGESYFTLTTTTAKSVPSGSVPYLSVLGFYYRNLSAGPVKLSVFPLISASPALRILTLAAGDEGYFTFPAPYYGGFNLQADTANAVTISIVGQN